MRSIHLAACLVTASLAAQTYRLPAIDSVSISRQSPNVFNDNRLRAYNNPTATYRDVVGLFKFDLSAVPDNAVLRSMRLILHMENAFNSPYQNPIVDLHRSADDAWTRGTATATSGALGPVVCANQQGFVHPAHAFTIDLMAHNFAQDLADDRLTLVIDNVNPAYSYVYFFGHTGSPVGTNAELEIVVTPACGTFTSFGSAGNDSRGRPVTMLAHGCAAPGQPMWLGASLGAGNPAALHLFLGVSNTTFGTIPLPLHLAFLGAPNHWLNVSFDVLVGPVPHGGGGGTRPLPVPNDAALSGRTLYAQVVAIDPPATPALIAMSNGLRITIQ
jgi:hypothetical protein